jgi:hypothetical protein
VTSKERGYPLPVGTLGSDEIVCQLVYLPNRPEYWQAFLGAYHYLTTWRAWERDGDKRGKNAATNWREAFELTMGCWRMTCLDEIEQLLREIKAGQCVCSETVFTQQPPGIAPNTGTPIIDDFGTPPPFYGEEPITTWGEWHDFKCESAYLLVEQVALKLEAMDGLLDATPAEDLTTEMVGWVISKIASLLAFITLAWDIFLGIADIGWSTLGDFSGAAAQIRAAAADIACAIVSSDGAEDCAADFEAACKTAVTSAAGDLMLGLFPWEAWANMIYTGTAITQDGVEVYLTDVIDAPGTHTCCLPALPEGASAYPVNIVDVVPVANPSHFTVNSISYDGATFEVDMTQITFTGQFWECDIVLAASPYYGMTGVSHRGIVYNELEHTHEGAQAIQTPAGYLHDTPAWPASGGIRCWVSAPTGGYVDELETYMGVTFDSESGTNGLNQNPDQNRTIRIKFLASFHAEPHNYKLRCTVGMYWALWKV